MKYNLRIEALGHGEGVEMTPEEYAATVAALRRIRLAADIEEKLDLLIENYVEYESELLNLALRNSLFPSFDYVKAMGEISVINRRTINLLTAARSYVDQLKHAVSKYFPRDGSKKAQVEALFSSEYEEYLEYRVAEALRNYAQHRSLPVRGMSWPGRWEEMDTQERRLRFWVVPKISLEQIVDEGGFKSEVLAELQASGKGSLPLTPILRRYIECLTKVHDVVRGILADQVEADHQTLVQTLDRARKEVRPKLTGLVVTKTDDLGKIVERHHVSDKSWNRRAALIEKNHTFPNLTLRYVSGEHPGDTD